MYPIKLNPSFKDYIWGGERLRKDFNKVSDLPRIAESWELSCHKDGESVVVGGNSDGLALSEYIEREGKSVLGTACEKFESFPVLIKLIDARDNLSVQVHPDNDYALRVEGEYGKTEMWYVIDCDNGAELIYGFNKEVTREEFADSIKSNTLLDIVNKVPVKKGDVFFIKSGTLHAIGKGILIAEIQQNSNTTYRVYDYGRVGADGKPRQLHIDKALDVTTLSPTEPYPKSLPVKRDGYESTLLSSCEYFTSEKLDVSGKASLYADISSFMHILIINGCASVCGMKTQKGDSFFIPAGYGKFIVDGRCTAILTYVK